MPITWNVKRLCSFIYYGRIICSLIVIINELCKSNTHSILDYFTLLTVQFSFDLALYSQILNKIFNFIIVFTLPSNVVRLSSYVHPYTHSVCHSFAACSYLDLLSILLYIFPTFFSLISPSSLSNGKRQQEEKYLMHKILLCDVRILYICIFCSENSLMTMSDRVFCCAYQTPNLKKIEKRCYCRRS